MAYRISRNLEASIIQFLESNLDSDWGNIIVEKSFEKVYNIPMNQEDANAIVCIRCGTTDHERVEVGSNATKREIPIIIDLFCANDGQKLDLKDYIIEKFKNGCIYYEYVIKDGAIESKTANGRISILSFTDEPLEFNTPKSDLDPHDRFRHRLTFIVSTGKYES